MVQAVIDLTQDDDDVGPCKAEPLPRSPILAHRAIYTDNVEAFMTPEPKTRASSVGVNNALSIIEASRRKGKPGTSPASRLPSSRISQVSRNTFYASGSGSSQSFGRASPSHSCPSNGAPGLNNVLNKATRKRHREEIRARPSSSSKHAVSVSNRNSPEPSTLSQSSGEVIVISDSDEERYSVVVPRGNTAKRFKRDHSTFDHLPRGQNNAQLADSTALPCSTSTITTHKPTGTDLHHDPQEQGDDWEWCHDSFIVSCARNWKELLVEEKNLAFETKPQAGPSSQMAVPSEKKSHSKVQGSAVQNSLRTTYSGRIMPGYAAKHILGSTTVISEQRFLHDDVARGFYGRLKKHVSLSVQFSLSSLCVVGELGRAGGSINTVVQSGDVIALSSDTVHGEADSPDMREGLQADVHNRPGTLQVNIGGTNHILHDHKRTYVRKVYNPRSKVIEDHSFDKYYAVVAVAFDPNRPSWMTSASADGHVTVRDVEQSMFAVKKFRPGKDACMAEDAHYPHSLHFRATDSALAISCSDGYIYVYNLGKSLSEMRAIDPRLHIRLNVGGKTRHNVGHMVWGNDDMLYASSESDNKGNHLGFDIQHPSKPVLKFTDAKDSGDALAIDPYQDNLALVTRSRTGQHILRLYDVRRRRRTASDVVKLEAFRFDYDEHWDSEVTCASYSPDGCLLAIARNDDRLHVYDTRYLGKEPLLQFFHWGEHRDDTVCGRDNDTQTLKRYGVTQMLWVQGWLGCGLGLVSGGGDGCVRLWDAMGSGNDPLNGEVLAQTDWSVGDFSLGDPHKGEKPLVVGDNGARAYIYDRTSRVEDLSP